MKEYKIIKCDITGSATIKASEANLNALANEGWQVIAVNSYRSNGEILVYTLEKFRQ